MNIAVGKFRNKGQTKKPETRMGSGFRLFYRIGKIPAFRVPGFPGFPGFSVTRIPVSIRPFPLLALQSFAENVASRQLSMRPTYSALAGLNCHPAGHI